MYILVSSFSGAQVLNARGDLADWRSRDLVVRLNILRGLDAPALFLFQMLPLPKTRREQQVKQVRNTETAFKARSPTRERSPVGLLFVWQ